MVVFSYRIGDFTLGDSGMSSLDLGHVNILWQLYLTEGHLSMYSLLRSKNFDKQDNFAALETCIMI